MSISVHLMELLGRVLEINLKTSVTLLEGFNLSCLVSFGHSKLLDGGCVLSKSHRLQLILIVFLGKRLLSQGKFLDTFIELDQLFV